MKNCRGNLDGRRETISGCAMSVGDRERNLSCAQAREAAQGKNPTRAAGGKRARMAAIGLDLPQARFYCVGPGRGAIIHQFR